MARSFKDFDNICIDPEFRDLFPPLSDEEYHELEAGILAHGIQDPIKVWTNPVDRITYLVDGHNRFEICKKHNILHIPLQDLDELDSKQDVIEYMITYQLGRRNLTSAQRVSIIEKYRPALEKKAKANQRAAGGAVPQKLAKLAGVSHDTYSKAATIINGDNDELKREVLSGKKSINAGYREIKPKKPDNRPAEDQQFATTDDCDQAIAEIEKQEQHFREEKKRLYLLRQKIYNGSPDADVRCEVIEITDEFGLPAYKFELYKGATKRDVDTILRGTFRSSHHMNEKIKYLNYIFQANKFSEKEKNIVLSKVYEVRESLLEEDAKQKTSADSFTESLNLGKYIYVDAIRQNPEAGEIFSAGYKALAKKYHPDLTHDNGQKMQRLNEAKDMFDKLIS